MRYMHSEPCGPAAQTLQYDNQCVAASKSSLAVYQTYKQGNEKLTVDGHSIPKVLIITCHVMFFVNSDPRGTATRVYKIKKKHTQRNSPNCTEIYYNASSQKEPGEALSSL